MVVLDHTAGRLRQRVVRAQQHLFPVDGGPVRRHVQPHHAVGLEPRLDADQVVAVAHQLRQAEQRPAFRRLDVGQRALDQVDAVQPGDEVRDDQHRGVGVFGQGLGRVEITFRHQDLEGAFIIVQSQDLAVVGVGGVEVVAAQQDMAEIAVLGRVGEAVDDGAVGRVDDDDLGPGAGLGIIALGLARGGGGRP